MALLSSKTSIESSSTINYRNIASKNLLIIFTRNPKLGKCKTRLAATVGDKAALEIYNFLLRHTVSITNTLDCAKQVWYSQEIWQDDVWDNIVYEKKLQEGKDLGIRMANAIQDGFVSGFEKIIIIGSDIYDLQKTDLQIAFAKLDENDFVVGPAEDGGYYLLGMKTFMPELFQKKNWGKETVLEATLNNLKNKKHYILEERNDVDLYEDIRDIETFRPYLKHLKE